MFFRNILAGVILAFLLNGLSLFDLILGHSDEFSVILGESFERVLLVKIEQVTEFLFESVIFIVGFVIDGI